MINVADAAKYPEFKGNVGFVNSHPLMDIKSSSGSHYGHDALTYMNVGEAMDKSMATMLKPSA